MNRIWIEPDSRDGWIVKREDPPGIYRFSDRVAAEKFAQALAQRHRPSTVMVRSGNDQIENEWEYPWLVR